jgi:hypothetical protein
MTYAQMVGGPMQRVYVERIYGDELWCEASVIECPVWVQAVSKRSPYFPYDIPSAWMTDFLVLRIFIADAVLWSEFRGL